MVERFSSKNYDKSLIAVCDDLSLPFWEIYGDYTDDYATPFIYINDSTPRLLLGESGWAHIDIINNQLNGQLDRDRALCGRLWSFKRRMIITLWAEDAPSELLNYVHIKNICNLFKEYKIDISNAKIVFEGTPDNSVKGWFDEVSFIYVYAISVNDYISKSMTSLSDVIREYKSQQKRMKYGGSTINRKEWQQFDDGSGNCYLGYHLMTRLDEDKQMINESVLADDLPDDIKSALINNTTSLGNNPAIPDIFDIPFLLKLAKGRFDDIKQTLLEIGTIDDFEDTEVNSMLSKLIAKCKEIERPYRNELEKLCVNYVIDTFKVPEDSIQLNVSLIDSVDLGNSSIMVEPDDSNDDFDDVNAASSVRGEIFKRRILDALCMGESLILSSNIDSYMENINKISPELPKLYLKIIALNNYSIYMSENLKISDKDKKQIGTVNVELGNEDEQVRITSQGEIFPVLLSETLRGFMELFISHGLPKDKKTATMVIRKSDFLKAEPWDMRLGPSLWVLFSKSFNDITLDELPYLLKRISSLDVDKFNFLMKEVFAKTKKGRQIMSKICAKAKNDIEYNRFTDKMVKMKLDKSVITDEYIKEEEL